MRILVACEESQIITTAFRAKGHEAYSCDLDPCSGLHSEWHIRDDVRRHLNDGFDLMIGHPPCTRLTNAVIWYIKKYDLWHEVDEAVKFFLELWNAPIEKICLENPIQHGYAKARLPKYAQIIQPYQFGEDASKATCLWLKGLPPLLPTQMFPPRYVNGKPRWGNQTDGGWNKLPPSPDRGRLRSKTYPGIAEGMANQWTFNN
jgi:hypothetical protein